MGVIVRAAAARSVLLVEAAVELPQPSPLLGPGDDRIRIDCPHGSGVAYEIIVDLAVGAAGGMDITVSGMPEGMLVVHHIVFEPPVGGEPPGIDDMLYPALLNRNAIGCTGIIRVVAGDIRVTGCRADPVACVRVIRVVRGLRTVLRDRERPQTGTVRAELPDIPDHRDGDQRFSADVSGARRSDKVIPARSGSRTGIAVALEVPVTAAVVGVELPVIPR